MFDYLQKYQQIPAEIRAKLDNASVKANIHQLEQQYRVSLFNIVMKVMVRDIPLDRLSFYLAENEGMNKEQAQKLVADLQANVFSLVQDYLSKPLYEPINIDQLVQHNRDISPSASTEPHNINFSETLEVKLNEFVSHQKIVKKSAELNRLRQIAKTYLLGVRNQQAFVDIATKTVAEGGLGLSADKALSLVAELNNIKQNLEFEARQQVNIQPPAKPIDKLIKQSIVEDFESELLANLRQIDKQPRYDLKTEYELTAGTKPETKLLTSTTEAEQEIVKQPTVKEAAVNQPAAVVVPLDQRVTDAKTGKIRMDDVKFIPKTLTPIDELATISLKKFRYLGPTATERTKKIKEKIDLLTEYGYSKRLQGINAWRHSPLNLLYLKIGQLSIEKGVSAEEILTKGAPELGEDILTLDEFKAILELNKQLRF